MAFNTWTALKQKMLDDLEANDTAGQSYTDPHGRRIELRSHEEWMKLYAFVEKRALSEQGRAGPVSVAGRVKR